MICQGTWGRGGTGCIATAAGAGAGAFVPSDAGFAAFVGDAAVVVARCGLMKPPLGVEAEGPPRVLGSPPRPPPLEPLLVLPDMYETICRSRASAS